MPPADSNPPLVGRHLGAYRVLAPIAAGGMGEVFRARDEKLGRDVALKLLPSSFASDADRLTRFEREARVLAALNHPHIAAIYGFVEEGDVRALALELVDGPTLAERLSRGPLPLATALHIAQEIASALEAAHDKGVIHRDLKPANIKLTADGATKVLDFGIAKIADGQDAGPNQTQAATVPANDTREGVVVGTAGYMSPEQVRGQPVDRRSDMWSFGCVLYEMLTGRAPFAADTSSDAIVAVLDRDPDWSRLPANTPLDVRRLLQRCLQKDPKQRLRDAGDMRLALEDAMARPLAGSTAARANRWLTVVAVAALVVVATALAILQWNRPRAQQDTPLPMTRATLTLPSSQELDTNTGAYPLAISPDGRRVAYVASPRGSAAQIYVRELDEFAPRAIDGTSGARYPFFAPDGQWLAFFADGKLKRVALAGGAPITVCVAEGQVGQGTWAADGTIVFDPGATAGLLRVAATGGNPEPLRTADPKMDALNVLHPSFLPGGRGLLVSAAIDGRATIAAISLDDGKWRVFGRGLQPSYVAPGFLVYHAVDVREGELHAVGFDPSRLETHGTPFAVLDGVFRARSGGATYFAVAQQGTLVFAPGGLAHTLVKVDRRGRRTRLFDERLGFRFPHLSPDGRAVAVTIDPRPSEVWVYDLSSGTRQRLSGPGHALAPLWTPDGRRVVFATRGDVYWRASDSSTGEERLLEQPNAQYAQSWSPDGKILVFVDDHPSTGLDLWTMRLGEAPTPLVVTPADENNAEVSPDGQWIAYTSNESGQNEIYVRPFPNVQSGKWVASVGGGHSPLWSRDGKELFYSNGNRLMASTVTIAQGRFSASPPETLFDGPFDATQDSNFDVSPDGTFFVTVEADPDQRPTRLQVVLNWVEELKRRNSAAATR